MGHHHAEQLSLVVLGSYAIGYLAGRSIAVLWTRGPVEEHGVRRIARGAAELTHQQHHRHDEQQAA